MGGVGENTGQEVIHVMKSFESQARECFLIVISNEETLCCQVYWASQILIQKSYSLAGWHCHQTLSGAFRK